MIKIPKTEFEERIKKIQQSMQERAVDIVLVYGDEYRKENLRYVSNFWPIFEQGTLLITKEGAPILLCAPENETLAKEMSVWEDIRLIPDFKCVTVSDEIDFPHADYTSFHKLAMELKKDFDTSRIGIVGIDAMSSVLLNTIQEGFDSEIVDLNDLLFDIRLVKTENEIACLKEAARIAEAGFRAMMESDLIGKTERHAASIAESVARREGAEVVVFTVFGSGERSASIIGRAENKVIEDGDMIMCAFAVQYEGYVATYEIPFAVGNYSEDTKRVLDVLITASAKGLPYLKAGVPMKKFVKAVRNHFREEGLEEYDVYPPLHGIGVAEAENPYPSEETEAVFKEGMTVNTDISLFGLKGGSNRVEEGFVITKDGAETLCPFMREYYENWLENN